MDLLSHIQYGVILHLVNARFGEFYAGLFHVLTAIENVLPLLALGLLIGQQHFSSARTALITFFISILIATVFGTLFSESQLLLYIAVFSFVINGSFVALQVRRPEFLIPLLAGITGVSQGLANGASMPQGMQLIQYTSGIIVAGLVLVTLTAGLVISFEKSWKRITIRVVGSWIAAIGIMYLPYLLLMK